MLRGAQTLGEIKGRTARIHKFENLGEVEETIQSLINFDSEEIFVIKLARSTGRDPRYVSVLSGEPEIIENDIQLETATSEIDELKEQLLEMKNKLENLQEEFDKFKEQF
jgi:uncharacterized protein YceH (UPF0502 family)